MTDSETLALTESEASMRIGVSISGLRKWRKNGRGPRYLKLGRLIRYRSIEIQSWLAAHTIDPGCDQGFGKENDRNRP